MKNKKKYFIVLIISILFSCSVKIEDNTSIKDFEFVYNQNSHIVNNIFENLSKFKTMDSVKYEYQKLIKNFEKDSIWHFLDKVYLVTYYESGYKLLFCDSSQLDSLTRQNSFLIDKNVIDNYTEFNFNNDTSLAKWTKNIYSKHKNFQWDTSFLHKNIDSIGLKEIKLAFNELSEFKYAVIYDNFYFLEPKIKYNNQYESGCCLAKFTCLNLNTNEIIFSFILHATNSSFIETTTTKIGNIKLQSNLTENGKLTSSNSDLQESLNDDLSSNYWRIINKFDKTINSLYNIK